MVMGGSFRSEKMRPTPGSGSSAASRGAATRAPRWRVFWERARLQRHCCSLPLPSRLQRGRFRWGRRAARSQRPASCWPDAAALASPLSGSGIHHALASGAAAARFAGDALGGRDGAWRAYAAWIRTHLAARLSAERIVHRIAGTPERIGPWLTLARIVPGAERALSSALLALG